MKIIKYLQDRFAMSEDGAKALVKSIIFSTLLNLSLMLPAFYVFIFLMDYLQPIIEKTGFLGHGIDFYILFALLLVVIMVIIAIFQYNATYIYIYDESAKRRINLAEKLRKLPLAFFAEKNLSDLTTSLMEDSTILERIFSHAIPQMYSSVLSLIIILISLFFYNWQLSLAIFWVVPISALIIFISKRSSIETYNDSYISKQSITEKVQEGLESIQEIKAYNGEDRYLKDLNNSIDSYESQQIKTELFIGSLLNLSYVFLRLGLVSVILVGYYLLSIGTVSLFVVLIFLIIASAIYNPIIEVFNNLAVLKFLDVRINRIKELNSLPLQEGSDNCNIDNFDIKFENVSFSYEEGKKVIDKVDFIAKQGEVTALVGPSGGGKSTLTKLAARFWDIDSGRILLGGMDISKINPEALLKNYSAVFQDVILFNLSIKDNIRIGKRDATDEEIFRAAKLAMCEEFINNLPDGYDTIIGENGTILSGGERQRLSIARALLKDAPIILLDEATASLDVENETKIQTAISELVKNKTVLIIAHRMRTIMNVNKIVFVKDGKVAEMGSPKELIEKEGDFYNMLNCQ